MRFAVLSSEVAARFSCHTTDERCWLEGILPRMSFWVFEAVGPFPDSARWLAIFQRYIAAYARHGLQTSACCVSSREFLSAMARKRPRSPDGNASGSPSARIATCCAVNFPIPGISHNRFNKASKSDTLSKLIRPSHTARARARSLGSSPSQSDAGRLGVGKDLRCGE